MVIFVGKWLGGRNSCSLDQLSMLSGDELPSLCHNFSMRHPRNLESEMAHMLATCGVSLLVLLVLGVDVGI